MAGRKGIFTWIIIGILIFAGLAVIWSIWYSLKDTKEKLDAQKAKMAELQQKDTEMRNYVDSLNVVLDTLRQKEQRLADERDAIRIRLSRLQREYDSKIARLDRLWEATAVIGELDIAFPHWKGQFWEAQRSDGVHGLIVPRFFGAEAAEIKAERNKSLLEIAKKDSLLRSFDHTVILKDSTILNLTYQRDTLDTSYKNLKQEYQVLNDKYNHEVQAGWFQLKLTPGNILTTGAGLGVGYFIGRSAGN